MDRLGLSLVLLAYNEEASIALAIEDCRRFGREHLASYEIIVVDDGSSDDTSPVARAASQGDVRVIRHKRNLGMGASMRDGYLAASEAYMAHLPGDRQVRAEALIDMLPLCSPDTVALSHFLRPANGQARALMSLSFRWLARHVGKLEVDFAGTYIFHRSWLSKIPLERAGSDTFLFSFQLLELMRRSGARFSSVAVPTHLREQGKSREARPGRIARMFVEIARARLR